MTCRVIFCILVLTMATEAGTPNEWHGLVPLTSTRTDVEKVLGSPTDARLNLYETKDEKVTIFYSRGKCSENKISVWNIPSDTVIRIIVSPKEEYEVSNLVEKLNISFKKAPDPEIRGIFTYVNEDSSIQFQTKVSKGIEDVLFVVYGPRQTDSALRCSRLTN